MNRDTVLYAVVEAERFIKGAKIVMQKDCDFLGGSIKDGTKNTAYLRRRSMELTRALANMRKPF